MLLALNINYNYKLLSILFKLCNPYQCHLHLAKASLDHLIWYYATFTFAYLTHFFSICATFRCGDVVNRIALCKSNLKHHHFNLHIVSFRGNERIICGRLVLEIYQQVSGIWIVNLKKNTCECNLSIIWNDQ